MDEELHFASRATLVGINATRWQKRRLFERKALSLYETFHLLAIFCHFWAEGALAGDWIILNKPLTDDLSGDIPGVA